MSLSTLLKNAKEQSGKALERVDELVSKAGGAKLVEALGLGGQSFASASNGSSVEGNLPACHRTMDPECGGGGARFSSRGLLAKVRPHLESKVANALDEANAWKKIVKELASHDASPELISETFAAINKLTPGLIKKLSSETAWPAFVSVCARIDKPEHTYFAMDRGIDLTTTVLMDLHQTRAGREKEFLKIMTAYDGRPSILRAFLLAVGGESRNPFKVCNDVQVLLPAAGELAPEAVKDETQKSRVELNAVGAAGAPIGRLYRVVDPKDPSLSICCGVQALLKIMEAFCPEKYASDKDGPRARRKKSDVASDLLRELTLDLIEEGGGVGGANNLPLLSRQLGVLEGLQAEIRNLKGESYTLKFGDRLLTLGDAHSRIRGYTGRQVIGWLREHYKELPSEKARIFDLLDDGLVEVSAAEAKKLWVPLVRYYLEHCPLKKEAALTPVLSDLKSYEEMRIANPGTLKKWGVPIVETAPILAELEGILHSKSSEITPSEAGLVLDKLGFLAEFREAANREALNRSAVFREDYSYGIAMARRLFLSPKAEGTMEDQTEARWREDSMGESVPRARLSVEACEGLKLGHPQGSSALHPALNREDFAALQEALRIETFSRSESLQLRMKPVGDFAVLANSVVLATRKARVLHNALCSVGVGTLYGEDLAKTISRNAPGFFSPELLAGGEYRLIEDWSLTGCKLTPDEVLARGKSFQSYPGLLRTQPWYRHVSRLVFELRSRVFNQDEALNQLTTWASALVENGELGDAIKKAAEIGNSPLGGVDGKQAIRGVPYLYRGLSVPYYTASEANDIRSTAAFHETFVAQGFREPEKVRDLMQQARGLARCTLIEGVASSGSALSVRKVAGPIDLWTDYVSYMPSSRIEYLDCNKMQEAIANRTRDYIAATELSPGWFQKLEALRTQQGVRVLRRAGIGAPDSRTCGVLASITSSADVLIRREFAEAIANLKL